MHMGSGVINTEIHTQYYDTSTTFCGTARDYESRKSRFWSLFCKELVTFNFIWGSLESVISHVTNATESDSKPYAGIKYLRANYKNKPIENYGFVLNNLIKIMTETNYFQRDDIYKNCSPKNSGSGLHLVSKIRNSFAHGSQSIPDLDDWEFNINNDIAVIDFSSRIVLLTMQMILISHFSKEQINLEHLFMFDDLYDLDRIELTSLLKIIHLPNYETLIQS